MFYKIIKSILAVKFFFLVLIYLFVSVFMISSFNRFVILFKLIFFYSATGKNIYNKGEGGGRIVTVWFCYDANI